MAILLVGCVLAIALGCKEKPSPNQLLASSKAGAVQVSLTRLSVQGAESDKGTGLVRVSVDKSVLAAEERVPNFEYPGDSAICFLQNGLVHYPSFVQYVNSGKPYEYHYMVSLDALALREPFDLKTRFGLPAIDSILVSVKNISR